MSSYTERSKIIKEIIRVHGKVEIEDLSSRFGISTVTANRDLNRMVEEGSLIRTRGGAIAVNIARNESYFFQRMNTNWEKKRSIGRKALDYIKIGDSIFLDSSTTVYALSNEIRRSDLRNITILTNQMRIVLDFEMEPNYTTILTGGKIRIGTYSLVGPVTELFLKTVRVDKSFISVRGINQNGELSDPDLEELVVKKVAIQNSREINVLIDSTKFGKTSLVKLADIGNVTRIITDNGVNKEFLNIFKDYNIEVVVPEE